jgi:RNA polymerase sigma factor (sigma-70 family)
MSTTESDALDASDMEQLVSGQDSALDRLMARHATSVFHFLCRMLGNEDDANDLAQETFVRVFRAAAKYRASQRFSTWLYTIAANLGLNHIRWRSRHPNVSLDAESEVSGQSLGDSLPATTVSPSRAVEQLECVAEVRAAVQSLPEDMREAIVLCEWEDKPLLEAAMILGATPKAVESRLYRARQLLRERLRKWL